MQGFVNAMDVLRDHWDGCTVLVLHHEGKSEDIRGSTVLPGAVDVSIRATCMEDPSKRKIMELDARKLRDMDTGSFPYPKLYARRVEIREDSGKLMLDEFGDKVTTLVVQDHPDHNQKVEELTLAFAELKGDPDQADGILDELEWFGLNSFGDSAVMLRARIKCVPGRQWGIGRAYNGVLKRVFDDRNIEIPFPHQTIFFGESKDGKTQPITVEAEPQAT